VRVVENLYPVLGVDSSSDAVSLGLQHIISGYGRHEVIIDHPAHGLALHEMSIAHLTLLLQVYRDRMRVLYASDPRLRYVLIFKNFGPAAGASIAHTHSQVIAMPVLPENVYSEHEHSLAYHRKKGCCIFCALIDEALTFEATLYDRESGEVKRRINVGQYVVEKSQHFVAVKPFASRYEWEVHILPLKHQADYVQVEDELLADFAGVLQRTMLRLDAVLGGAQYNFFLHSLAHGCDHHNDCSTSYHWHLEICPRTSIPTGFELGSGLFVSTISPEAAAAQLRAVPLPGAAS
jgi:UDPglucose--hexose-1-phosphate uridylyltransferase